MLGDACTDDPSATRLETDESPSEPSAPFPDARALARTKTASAVISPPKSETDWTVALPDAVARATRAGYAAHAPATFAR